MLSVGMREPERGCGRIRPAGDGVGARRAEVERSRKRSLTEAFWCAESVSASGNVRAMERARHQRSPPGSRQGRLRRAHSSGQGEDKKVLRNPVRTTQRDAQRPREEKAPGALWLKRAPREADFRAGTGFAPPWCEPEERPSHAS